MFTIEGKKFFPPKMEYSKTKQHEEENDAENVVHQDEK
jgi:hypothetical protein